VKEPQPSAVASMNAAHTRGQTEMGC
jgi:hypothetical protein